MATLFMGIDWVNFVADSLSDTSIMRDLKRRNNFKALWWLLLFYSFYAENCPGTASWLADHGAATEESTRLFAQPQSYGWGKAYTLFRNTKVRASFANGNRYFGQSEKCFKRFHLPSEISTMLVADVI